MLSEHRARNRLQHVKATRDGPQILRKNLGAHLVKVWHLWLLKGETEVQRQELTCPFQWYRSSWIVLLLNLELRYPDSSLVPLKNNNNNNFEILFRNTDSVSGPWLRVWSEGLDGNSSSVTCYLWNHKQVPTSQRFSALNCKMGSFKDWAVVRI